MKLYTFCLSGNLPGYTKKYFQKEIFPRGANTAMPVNIKAGRLWLGGQGLALAINEDLLESQYFKFPDAQPYITEYRSFLNFC